uniref:Putative dual kunitz salivary protein n=1 Tax=Ornithodoros turicata TaxID=34597 RepID=A0A2R5L8L8_9ACAR
MEPKVFVVCIIVLFFGVSDSAKDLPKKCTVKREVCKKASLLKRFYYNETKRRCSSFLTCPGEGDNFYPRMLECVRDCKPRQKPAKCYKEKARRCRGDTSGATVWTYDLTQKRCERVENACKVTRNKFLSQEDCVLECNGFDKNGLQERFKNKKP